MGKHKNRRLYYYFGRNERYDYIAIPMSNSLFVMNKDWGSNSFINNALVRMIMECNPRELSIDLVRSENESFEVWSEAFNGKRYIPQLKSLWTFDRHHIDSGKYLVEFLEEIKSSIDTKLSVLEDYDVDNFKDCDTLAWEQKVYVFDRFNELIKLCTEEELHELMLLFKELINVSEKSGVYFIVTCDCLDIFEKYDMTCLFSTSIVSKVDEVTSQLLLNNSDANTILNSQGDVYVAYRNELHHLYVPFYPDTWIKKFIRYYGVLRN